jgi:peptidyl-prolyl cis-trans isomerase B (cyclophilin B)
MLPLRCCLLLLGLSPLLPPALAMPALDLPQQPASEKAPPAATADPALDVRLKPRNKVARAGSKLELVLRIEAKADAKIDGTVLFGTNLETTVDGKPGPALRERLVDAQVQIGPKVALERSIEVDLERIAPNVAFGDGKAEPRLVPVTFTWPGLAGASATVDLAPDSSKIDIATLDLEQTRVLLVTSYGQIVVKFFPKKAPVHVKSFLKLSQSGFYDGTKLHRVIKGFMVQGGCPNTKEGARGIPGTGDPGYTLPAEFNDTRHVRGILSMARSMDPNSAGCQFFLMHGEQPALDGKYTAFGAIESGLETLDKIADVAVQTSLGGEAASSPVQPVHLYAAIVLPVLKK